MPTIPNAINSEPGVSVLRPTIRPETATSRPDQIKLTHKDIDPNAPEATKNQNIQALTIEQHMRIFDVLDDRVSLARNRIDANKSVSPTDLLIVQLAAKHAKLRSAQNEHLAKKADYELRKKNKQLKEDDKPPPEVFVPPTDSVLNDQEQVQLDLLLRTVAQEYMALGGFTLNQYQFKELNRTIEVTQDRKKKKVPTQQTIKQVGVLEKHGVSVDTGIFADRPAEQNQFLSLNHTAQEKKIYDLLYEEQRLRRHITGRSTEEGTDVLIDTPLTDRLSMDIENMRLRILQERHGGANYQRIRDQDLATAIRIDSEATQLALHERGAKAALDIIQGTNKKYATAGRIAKAQAAETAATAGTQKYTKLDAAEQRIEITKAEYEQIARELTEWEQKLATHKSELATLVQISNLRGKRDSSGAITEKGYIDVANDHLSDLTKIPKDPRFYIGDRPSPEDIQAARDQIAKFSEELRLLEAETGNLPDADRDTKIQTLTQATIDDKVEIANRTKLKALTETVADTERAAQIEAIREAAAPAKINEIQSLVLVRGDKETHLQDMNSLRELLKLDYEILTDKRLRSLIGQMLGIDVRDIDDTAVLRTLKAAQKTNPAIPLDQAITKSNERAVIQQGMEENARILRELKLRSSPEVAMTLLGIIHERLEAAGMGLPTTDIGFRQEINLPQNRVVTEQTSALYQAGIVEGINAIRLGTGINVNGVHYEVISQGAAPTVYVQETDAAGNLQLTKVGTIDVKDNNGKKEYVDEINPQLSNQVKDEILREIFVTTIDQHAILGAEGLTIPVLKLFDPARPTTDIQGDTTQIRVHEVNGEYMVRITPEQTSTNRVELPYDMPIREYMTRYPEKFNNIIRTQAADQLYALKQAGTEIHNTEQTVITSLHRGEISGITSQPTETTINWKEALQPSGSRELIVKVKNNGNVEILEPPTRRGRKPTSLVKFTGTQAINNFINSADVLAGSTANPTTAQKETAAAAQKALPYALARHYFTLTPQERTRMNFQNQTLSVPLEFSRDPNTGTTIAGSDHQIEIYKQADGELMVRDLITHTNPERALDFLERMNNVDAFAGKWGIKHGMDVQQQIGLSILEGMKQTP